jgi:16S rRNA (uracil1498-N3)-methyltransferase
MDTLVEKATELGAHAIQPLLCMRSVVRLEGERAAKKVAHWQSVAVAASEQCGRAVVPQVLPVVSSLAWLQQAAQGRPAARAEPAATAARAVRSAQLTSIDGSGMACAPEGGWHARGVLSLRDAAPVGRWLNGLLAERATTTPALDEAGAAALAPESWCFFSGPEGGLTPEEEDLALSHGWQAVSLGRRVLRADTAPLAVLSVIAAAMEA